MNLPKMLCNEWMAILRLYLCKDPVLLERFEQQLSRAAPYKVHTDYFYSVTKGRVPIYTFSGITTSDPSKHSLTVSKNDTEWYRATH